ncbi:hypothetical protein QBZ16_001304 [Prototheca wickerhamii]|uniref:EF-hand domain-containing protein n=1 Tax=Prototheca wickerhamii TaxID=3111 RepID=A0AAD9IDK3_PROWI|nr:hypothetical protein QBZ16_001304 [Prototheca wickerhamii]
MRGKSEAEAQACVLAHFTKADRDRDSRLSYEEFEVFYALITKPSLRVVLARSIPEEIKQLYGLFSAVSTNTGRQGVTNTQFVKLIRTCQGLETTEVTALDIIFAKAKAQGERVLNFDEFVEALDQVADKADVDVETVIQKLIAAHNSLREVYEQFSAFGRSRSVTPEEKAGLRQISDQGRSLDGTRFAKLCRDAGLVGSGKSKPSASAVELAFAKVKPKMARRITFKEFVTALKLLAQGVNVPEDEFLEKVAACSAPSLNGITTPENSLNYPLQNALV